MAPRANWKGFLRLSLVTCPIALFPATSESENQFQPDQQENRLSDSLSQGRRRNRRRGVQRGHHQGLPGRQGPLSRGDEGRAREHRVESTRTIEIDEFVPRSEIEDLYLVRPYYIVPDGKVGHDAFAAAPDNVVNLMDALRASLKSAEEASAAARSSKTPANKTATRKRKAG